MYDAYFDPGSYGCRRQGLILRDGKAVLWPKTSREDRLCDFYYTATTAVTTGRLERLI